MFGCFHPALLSLISHETNKPDATQPFETLLGYIEPFSPSQEKADIMAAVPPVAARALSPQPPGNLQGSPGPTEPAQPTAAAAGPGPAAPPAPLLSPPRGQPAPGRTAVFSKRRYAARLA